MATPDAFRKPVVIFRSEKGPNDPYAMALREAGFDPQFVQVLQFEFGRAHELASALLDSSKFSEKLKKQWLWYKTTKEEASQIIHDLEAEAADLADRCKVQHEVLALSQTKEKLKRQWLWYKTTKEEASQIIHDLESGYLGCRKAEKAVVMAQDNERGGFPDHLTTMIGRMVLTSQTAVESCVHSLSLVSTGWQEELTEQWNSLPVFVVGKATSQAVGKLGLMTTGSVSGSAEALSQTILEYLQSHDKATLSPLLFPCGSMRRETLPTVLPQGGVNVHSIMCYDTVEDPNIAANLRSLAEKKVLSDGCWVVFFSPSGVKFALHHLKLTADTDKLKIAAIGPTTAEALTGAGLPPSAVASKPSPDSLLQAMLNVHR